MKHKNAALAAQPPYSLTIVAALALSLVLTGCGAVAQASLKSVGIAMRAKPDVAIDADAIANSRFAQIKVASKDASAILVLGNIDGQRQAWYSSDQNIVFLQQGLVVATHGGTPELRGMSILGKNPFVDLRDVVPGATVQRRYDVMPGYHYGMLATGTLNPVGHETLSILGKQHSLLHVKETLQGTEWSATNHYWVDPGNGFVWKSVQAIGPDASLEITQLKPFAADLERR